MNEVLGLLDSIEATILEGKKIPLTDKVVLEEPVILSLIDKVRLVIKSNGEAAKSFISTDKTTLDKPLSTKAQSSNSNDTKIKQDALEYAHKIKSGANEYADFVLSNVQLMLTKMQKDMVRFDQNLENGREILEKQKKEKVDYEERK